MILSRFRPRGRTRAARSLGRGAAYRNAAKPPRGAPLAALRALGNDPSRCPLLVLPGACSKIGLELGLGGSPAGGSSVGGSTPTLVQAACSAAGPSAFLRVFRRGGSSRSRPRPPLTSRTAARAPGDRSTPLLRRCVRLRPLLQTSNRSAPERAPALRSRRPASSRCAPLRQAPTLLRRCGAGLAHTFHNWIRRCQAPSAFLKDAAARGSLTIS